MALEPLETPNLKDLLRRAQEGCAESAQSVLDCCRDPLLAVIRQIIRPPLRKLFDSDDFLAIAFAEIFTHHFTDEVLESPATLWPYLKKITENKVRDANRKHVYSVRRTLCREVSLACLSDEILGSRKFNPEDLALFKELVEERLDYLIGQQPLVDQAILGHLLNGDNGFNIANSLGIDKNYVYRSIDRLRSKLRLSV